MQTATPPLPDALGQPGIRVRTLVLIRWMAIGGQSLTLLIVAYGLGYDFPHLGTASAVLASAILNLGLIALYPPKARLVGAEALLHLGFDLVQLGVLLYLTGGIANPFCVLMLVPVTISATLLSARATLALTLVATAILLGLWQGSLPLPWRGAPPMHPPIYMFANFVALAFTLIFLGIYVLRVAIDARRWQQALVITQAVLERETKMSALGALAAAAAHELGGPLGTIKLIARDLEDQLSGDPDFGGDVELLNREAERCRAILAGIAQRSEAEAPFPHLPLAAVLHETAQPFDDARVPVSVAPADGQLPTVRRTPELRHGLLNLIDNAVRHAKSRVTLSARADAERVTIAIEDDGPGFPPDLLPHLGEPFLGPSRSARGGTGLGVFIATTLLDRTGAAIRFRNGPGGGGRVEIRWSRADIESL